MPVSPVVNVVFTWSSVSRLGPFPFLFFSHIAAAALPDPALHPHLQRGDDVLLGKPEFEEDGQSKPDHDRRSAETHLHGTTELVHYIYF